jgi:molecular chaperone GrpE
MSNEENENVESEKVETELEAETVETEVPDNSTAAQLEAAQKKADQHWDELLRARAEMENLRRRQARDLENAHKHALDKFVTELLPIYDSMELGLNAANNDEASLEAVREGLEMTMKMFLSSISKFGLEQVNPEGQAFDPELHQAVAMQPAEGVEANQVISVMQKGYQFNGRLLRPAIVTVSQ